MPVELLHSLAQTEDAGQLTYLISSSLRMSVADAQEILAQEDILAKMLKLTDLVHHEMEVLELGKKIQAEAHGEGNADADTVNVHIRARPRITDLPAEIRFATRICATPST